MISSFLLTPNDVLAEIEHFVGDDSRVNPGEGNRFNQELAEWLKPSQEVMHQTGLHLINTRLWLDDLSRKYDQEITIGSVPQQEWNDLFQKYEAFWFMGIYKPSEASRLNASTHPKSIEDLSRALPNLDPQKDVTASPFAIPSYEPNPLIAHDWDEWDSMVEMLHSHNKKAIVDFVPNHVAVDHPWVNEHPEYFIHANEEQYSSNPDAYVRVLQENGEVKYLAHGRDPNFPFWADTLQLNYANPELQNQMESILLELVDHSDGVRCDMAMLINPDTFIRTWGDHLTEEEKTYINNNRFWDKAISKAKARAAGEGRGFIFIAEAYWDTETLREVFDYMYRKELYDDLVKFMVDHNDVGQDIKNNIAHILSERRFGYVLFTENHDESRAVEKFGKEGSKAAAALTGLIPNSIFLLNQGQELGWEKRVPMQLNHFIESTIDEDMVGFYDRLLFLKHSRLFQEGEWSLYDINSDNPNLISLRVKAKDRTRLSEVGEINAVICINLGNSDAEGSVQDAGRDASVLVYRLNHGDYVKEIDNQRVGGIYVKLDPWETQVVFYEDS